MNNFFEQLPQNEQLASAFDRVFSKALQTPPAPTQSVIVLPRQDDAKPRLLFPEKRTPTPTEYVEELKELLGPQNLTTDERYILGAFYRWSRESFGRNKFTCHEDSDEPYADEIFVFGSNLQGIHGKGAARAAELKYGAQRGVGEGPTGRSYAIPTRTKPDARQGFRTLPIKDIAPHVARFKLYTYLTSFKWSRFFLTRTGCGEAGYHDEDIAPLFRGMESKYVRIPRPWLKHMHPEAVEIVPAD